MPRFWDWSRRKLRFLLPVHTMKVQPFSEEIESDHAGRDDCLWWSLQPVLVGNGQTKCSADQCCNMLAMLPNSNRQATSMRWKRFACESMQSMQVASSGRRQVLEAKRQSAPSTSLCYINWVQLRLWVVPVSCIESNTTESHVVLKLVYHIYIYRSSFEVSSFLSGHYELWRLSPDSQS